MVILSIRLRCKDWPQCHDYRYSQPNRRWIAYCPVCGTPQVGILLTLILMIAIAFFVCMDR